jgi:hypothetical protein
MSDFQNNPNHSPLYELVHTSRYQRQSFIRDIENCTNRRLIVYFSNVRIINQEDVAPFQEMLLDCDAHCDIDLLIQSGGGDIDVAEKLVYMLRSRANNFRVIVAERAKSAATMMALASDEILMSSTSELGPIDPQITFQNAQGNLVSRPARSFLDGLEEIKRKVTDEGGINPAYYPLISQLDPATLDFCNKALQRAEGFAKKWLSKYMLKDDQDQAAKIAARLIDVQTYSSHGMVIDWQEAKNLGLNVTYLDTDDAIWQKLWRLYLAYEVGASAQGYSKIFEGRKISLTI